MFCQQDTSHSTAKIKAGVQELEVDIMRMEEGLPRYTGASVGPLLHEKRLELSSLLQERVNVALVWPYFLQLPEFFLLQPKEICGMEEADDLPQASRRQSDH